MSRGVSNSPSPVSFIIEMTTGTAIAIGKAPNFPAGGKASVYSFEVHAEAGNAASIYVGDADITSSIGVEAEPGSQFVKYADNAGPYNTEEIYLLGTTGDTARVLLWV